jgi:hypothetical protein
MYIARVILAIIAGIFTSVVAGTFLIVFISDAGSQDYVQNLILGIGLLFALLSFLSKKLRTILCVLAGSCIVYGLVLWLPNARFAFDHPIPNVSPLFSAVFYLIISFFSIIVFGIILFLGVTLIYNALVLDEIEDQK